MKSFKSVSPDEIERINKLQADYFDQARHFFDPPYPEGVPERLEQIVAAAAINPREIVADIGTGTGVLVPLIQACLPGTIYANDLSESMLASVRKRYPGVKTIKGGIRKVGLPDSSVDVFLVNACYPNLVDKHTTFLNLQRMIRRGGRVVISHPMGKAFIKFLKKEMPFPIDDFPDSKLVAQKLFYSYGFGVKAFVDETLLYILVLESIE
ncbi:MAG: class I SAM-dependent methyltransferase [Desulfobacteraceae bacterium]|nr:class I SAM-dependent methyltransferase [Desulfobacteraceae bacterium]